MPDWEELEVVAPPDFTEADTQATRWIVSVLKIMRTALNNLEERGCCFHDELVSRMRAVEEANVEAGKFHQKVESWWQKQRSVVQVSVYGLAGLYFLIQNLETIRKLVGS